MISILRGQLAGADRGGIVVDVGGVGYLVTVNDRDQGVINARGIGADVVVHVRSVWSESAGPRLFGFLDAHDRDVFDALRSADGVGPVTAIKALSMATGHAIRGMVVTGNRAGLQRLPGVGPKTVASLLDARAKWVTL